MNNGHLSEHFNGGHIVDFLNGLCDAASDLAGAAEHARQNAMSDGCDPYADQVRDMYYFQQMGR